MRKMKYVVLTILLLIPAAVAILLIIKEKNDRDGHIVEEGGVVRNYHDPDAPKIIKSTEITEFNCVISTFTLVEDEKGISGNLYTFDAVLKDDKVKIKYTCRVRNKKEEAFEIEESLSFMEELYDIVSRYNFAKNNGYVYFVSGLPDMYGASLTVNFASGETIHASNNQSCFLAYDAMVELVELFEKEVSAVKEEKLWQSMQFYRSHSVWSRCFNVSVRKNEDGSVTLLGYCNAPDGKEYSYEEGFLMSEEGFAALRRLELDNLPKAKNKISLGPQVMDGVEEKLTLTYKNGNVSDKELTDETLEKIFSVILCEFEDWSEAKDIDGTS